MGSFKSKEIIPKVEVDRPPSRFYIDLFAIDLNNLDNVRICEDRSRNTFYLQYELKDRSIWDGSHHNDRSSIERSKKFVLNALDKWNSYRITQLNL